MAGENKRLGIIRAWVKATTYDAKKIADHFGISEAIVKKMCEEERPWQNQKSL